MGLYHIKATLNGRKVDGPPGYLVDASVWRMRLEAAERARAVVASPKLREKTARGDYLVVEVRDTLRRSHGSWGEGSIRQHVE